MRDPEQEDRSGLRLLTVTHYFASHRGGVELVAEALARALSARGFRVTWAATDASPGPRSSAVRAVALRAWNGLERRLGLPYPLLSPSGLAALFREVRRSDRVLIHDCLYPTSIAAFLMARLFRRPVVLVQHIAEVPYRSRLLRALMRGGLALAGKPMLASADQVVFISRTTGRAFADVRFRREPLFIFNGVSTETFSPTDAAGRETLRRSLALTAPVALFVGRFVEKKGLHLLRRMAEARPDITWALAGWGPLDPDAWALPNVRVFRKLEGADLAGLYRACDLLVLPSVGEGLPLVVQEALACGLPVVCNTETAAADDALSPLVQGVAHAAQDERTADAYLSAIDATLSAPAGEAAAAARAATAAARYSWPAAADRYAEVLRSLQPGTPRRLARLSALARPA